MADVVRDEVRGKLLAPYSSDEAELLRNGPSGGVEVQHGEDQRCGAIEPTPKVPEQFWVENNPDCRNV